MTTIRFGTSGWRAIIADEFTFANARIVTRAIADHLIQGGRLGEEVLVSHDTRFLGERFAIEAAAVLSGSGLRPVISERDAPTPALAFEVVRRKAAGIINFTASHNPPEYGGLKFSPADGSPATKEMTSDIEAGCARLISSGSEIPLGPVPSERFDPRPAYIERLGDIVDLDLVGKAGLKVAVDCMHGTSRGYLDAVLRGCGAEVETLNENPDPTFGGHQPEPTPEYLPDLLSLLDGGFDLGLATDGDADRFGIFDRGGRAISPNEVIAVLLDYLNESRGWTGTVVRSVTSSHLIDRVAAARNCAVVETPVGFKWIAEAMRENGDFVIGGEESGGLTIRGHLPEKDGILACLLAAEMRAGTGEGPGARLDRLLDEVGIVKSRRVNIAFRADDRARIIERLEAKAPADLAGLGVVKTIRLDGYKYLLEGGSWVCVRFSGTEPLVRCYIEAVGEISLDDLEAAGRALVGGDG